MDCTVNSRFKSGTQLVILIRAGGFRSCDPRHGIIKKASLSFSYSDRKNARMFVKRDQASRHKCMIGRPGWALIG